MIWSRFADRVFAARPIATDEPRLDDLLLCDDDEAGVTLVGAGPGGTEFLTFAAVRALADGRRHSL